MKHKYSDGRFTAYTLNSQNGVFREIIVPAKIRIPEIFKEYSHEFVDTYAIWDTGATNSVLSKDIISKFNLKSTGKTIVHGVHGKKEVNTYIIDIVINKIIFKEINVTEGVFVSKDINFLVGMDLIASGDFALTCNKDTDNKTCNTFSYRYPPLFKPIDFVKEINRYNIEVKEKEVNKKLRKQYTKNKRKKQ